MTTPTTIKVIIDIESDRVGSNVRGEFCVSDILFSDITHRSHIDEEQMVKDVRQCIKALKGFSMLTIRITNDVQYNVYPKVVDSVRFTNRYGEIKMAYADGNYYNNWIESNEKFIYTMVRKFVHDANGLHAFKLAMQKVVEQ